MSDQPNQPPEGSTPDVDEAAEEGPIEAAAGTTGAAGTDEPAAGSYEERDAEEEGRA